MTRYTSIRGPLAGDKLSGGYGLRADRIRWTPAVRAYADWMRANPAAWGGVSAACVHWILRWRAIPG